MHGLSDLENDLNEFTDLADDPQLAGVKGSLGVRSANGRSSEPRRSSTFGVQSEAFANLKRGWFPAEEERGAKSQGQG